MSRIENLLTRLEAQLRLVVEGDGRRDGFPRKLHLELARQLAFAMKTSAREPSMAPDEYILVLPAIDAQILLTHPGEMDRLTRRLEEAASQGHLSFAHSPVLHVVADPQAVRVNVQATFSQPGMGSSSTYQMDEDVKGARQENGDILPAAFLIVNGLSTFAIQAALVNIGRDPSNQLQLLDAHISPRHAQIRFVQGHFVIFDLDSHEGTFVNGVAVSSHALKAGDVIQLGGLPLVYGQDASEPAGQTQELPAELPPPEVL